MEELEEKFQEASGCTMAHFFSGKNIATFNPKKLTMVERQQIVLLDIIIEGTIIGESHFVRVEIAGKTVFVELLACVNPLKLGFKPDLCSSLERQKKITARHVGEMINFTAAAVIRTKSADRELHVPSKKEENTLLLEQTFPGPMAPRTIVWLYLDANGVIWIKSLHEYTMEDGLIEPLVSASKIFIPALVAKMREL